MTAKTPGPRLGNGSIQQEFTLALDALVEQMKGDHPIRALREE